ncbi:hypothetical protein [Pelomonas cellulosilytica]|uniref:Uncharacterized protein n=1 Tax=Pelomonas cellulosilytica TaxID=2906762 RepID=A0ABS8XP06_9BURK|nr:hypothetical protein [Pelomonas sp. P8]MCE4554492.1 hypothetical protein [Pelomonas sp. P8]
MLLIVLFGFARSFYARPLFTASPLTEPLMLHGAVLTLWFLLTTVQAWLAVSQRRAPHRQLAWLAMPIVAGVIASGAWVNTALALQLTSAEDPENMFIWANYMSLLSFLALVVLAVAYRRRLATHRRLMLFASVAIVGPAFARFAFWPVFGKLGLAIAPAFAVVGMLLLMGAAMSYDLFTLRRPQAATWGGLAGVLLPLLVGIGVALSGMGYNLLHHA